MNLNAEQIHEQDKADSAAGMLIHQNPEKIREIAEEAYAALVSMVSKHSAEPIKPGSRICPGCLSGLLFNILTLHITERKPDRQAAAMMFEKHGETFLNEAESIRTGMPPELAALLRQMGDNVKVEVVNAGKDGDPDLSSPSSVAAALGSLFQKKA